MTRFATSLALLAFIGSAIASEPYPVERAPGLPDYGRVTLGGPSLDGIGQHHTVSESPAKNRTEAREMGVAWLKKIQQKDGGWGAGVWGEATHQVQTDSATTAFVTLALIRDAKGTDVHNEAIARGVDYVVRAIEASDAKSPRLQTPDGTQIQYKLGQLVDTHLASLLLGEVYGKMGPERNKRIGQAYDKVLAKVAMAQQSDGSFDSNGWAPVLSTSIAAQSLYKAGENGVAVEQSVLDRADSYAAAQVSADGAADASSGAGVQLYGVATALAGNSKAKRRAGSAAAPEAEEKSEAMARAVASDDGRLVSGFGSMGGEEMLSYMMISDSLAADGGKRFDEWDEKIGAHLMSIQNGDGSWVGHHCITSPVFVTAGAVATLAAKDFADLHKQAADEATGS
ncbi:MAG: hypothetical protein EP330_29815 [Deltaproteobacteria bacterium]|nr:MAG: hypothetical protein EP330_29815 [Deltaproteobacteria bacterium]